MKAVILLSGGIDSTVALAEARGIGRSCECLICQYGQANWQGESWAAKRVAEYYGCALATLQIDGTPWKGKSFLTGGSSNPLESYVPARNVMLLAHAIAYAESWGAEEVWFGPNREDADFYPDCRRQFVAMMSSVAELGTKSKVRITAPHLERTKTEIIQRGIELQAPLWLTTSCADSSGRCGVCRGCMSRRKAFAAIDNDRVRDVTTYLADMPT